MNAASIIKELRRPFTPEAVQFKIQTSKGNRALLVCFIDARQTGERLNLICPEAWSDAYREVSVGALDGVECSISIRASGNSLTRTDIGIQEGGMGGLKAVYSDAFKRAGVKWGIGVPLYYTPRFYADKSALREYNGNFYLSKQVEDKCRNDYAAWLKKEGIQRFGEPLDLGETSDEQGDTDLHTPTLEELAS